MSKNTPIRIFISHSKSDTEFAEKIRDHIVGHKMSVWLDSDEIQIGDHIVERIIEGLSESDFLILIISKEAVKSNWVAKEWGHAIYESITKKKTIVLPLLKEQCDLPPFIGSLRYADFQEYRNFNESFNELLTAIKHHSKRQSNFDEREVKRNLESELGDVDIDSVHDQSSYLDQPYGPLTDETIAIEKVNDLQDSEFKVYWHPVFNLLSGKRLYYLFVKVNTALSISRVKLDEILTILIAKKSLTLECQCSYVLLGDQDFLIKVWADEVSRDTLVRDLRKNEDVSGVWSLLVYRTDTWYQRSIERRGTPEWLTEDQINEIAFQADTPESLHVDEFQLKIKSDSEFIRKSNRKFWIIIHHPKSIGNRQLLNFVQELRQLTGAVIDHPIYFTSIYSSYSEDESHSTILKAESRDPVKSIHSLLGRLHEQQQSVDDRRNVISDLSTSTYIAVERLREENHTARSMNDRKKIVTRIDGEKQPVHLDLVRGIVFSNILISHKVNSRTKSVNEDVKTQFIRSAQERYSAIFRKPFHARWNHNIHKLRRLYIWLSRNEDTYAKAFFLEDYIDIEARLRELFDPLYADYATSPNTRILSEFSGKVVKTLGESNAEENIVRQVSTIMKEQRKKIEVAERKSSKKTMGSLPPLIKAIYKRSGYLDEEQKTLLSITERVVSAITKDRNRIAHGEVSSISTPIKLKIPWHGMLDNYIDLLFEVDMNMSELKAIVDLINER